MLLRSVRRRLVVATDVDKKTEIGHVGVPCFSISSFLF